MALSHKHQQNLIGNPSSPEETATIERTPDLPGTVNKDQVQHELERKKPCCTNDDDPQQGRIVSTGSKRIGHDGGRKTDGKEHAVGDGGHDAAASGEGIPTVETKPGLNEPHDRRNGSAYFTSSSMESHALRLNILSLGCVMC